MPTLRLASYICLFALRDIFPVSFYGRDLKERLRSLLVSLCSCISAFLNVTTLTILVITTTLVAGLYTGTVRWIRNYVESNPMARTVEVSSTFGTRVSVFDEDSLNELRQLVADEGPQAVQAVHGWNDVTFWFFRENRGKDDSLTHGRTVDPADPLLGHMKFLAGNGHFQGEGIAQVVVSLSLLDSLGYGREPPFPDEIQLDYFNRAAPLQVLGVCESTPAGEFLITENFNRQMQDRQWDPAPRIPGLYFGPVSPSTQLEDALASLRPYLDGPRVQVEMELAWRAGNERWLLFQREEPWIEERWRQLFLPAVKRRLGTLAAELRVEFLNALPPEHAPRNRLSPQFTRASVYVKTLQQVPTVADAITARGLQVTSNSRELALLFLQISSLGRGFLLAVILVVGGLASVSLVLSFTQNIQQKTPEIAILKAFGGSSLLVLLVYVLEAILLWALSTTLALLVVRHLASMIEVQLQEILRLQGDLAILGEGALVALPYSLQFTVALGALLLSVLATVFAGLLAVRLQPAQALSLHR